MKFQIPNFKSRISKNGRTINSPLEIRDAQFVRAFTLIEVMVSLAVFAMLIGAVYSTWLVILRSARVEQEAAAQVQRQRIAIRTIEDSLTCIQSFQASMGYYTFNVTNDTDHPTLSFVAHVPDVFPRNGRFNSDLRRLTFSVESVSGAEKDLVLRQNEILKDMDADEQQTPLVLARNVKDFVVECWDTNALDWATEWDSTNSLPPMVRVTLTLGGKADDSNSSSPTLAITREIAVPSNTLPRIAQTGSPNAGGGGGNLGVGGGNNLGTPGGNQNSPAKNSPFTTQ